MKRFSTLLFLLILSTSIMAQSIQETILNDLQNKTTLENQQLVQISEALNNEFNIFDLETIICPLLTQDQVKAIFESQLKKEANKLAVLELNSTNFCKPINTPQRESFLILLEDKYLNRLIFLKQKANIPTLEMEWIEQEHSYRKKINKFLFTNNLTDAKYSQIFANPDLLQLNDTQKEQIFEAYFLRSNQLKEINKDGIFNSLDYTEINQTYNESLLSILNAKQYDYYLELVSKPRVIETVNNKLLELEMFDMLSNGNRKKVEKEIMNYYMEEEKLNKKYEWNYDKRQKAKKLLRENRPTVLRQLKSAQQFQAQGKKYQGNYQW